jgi:hypothetical protein
MPSYVLLDETNGAKTASGEAMTPVILADIAAACEVQLNRDLAPTYGLAGARVRAGKDRSDIQPGEWVFTLLPTVGVPDAEAYHDVDGHGVPVLWDAITLSDTLTGLGNSTSVAISHELCETTVDGPCNIWCDNGAGVEVAKEASDAVEAQSYKIDGIGVSNFVMPAFFTPHHSGPYDFMSTVGHNADAPKAPFDTTPGGYQIERSSGEGEHQVTARHCASIPVSVSVGVTVPFGHRRPFREGSRRARRGVRAENVAGHPAAILMARTTSILDGRVRHEPVK